MIDHSVDEVDGLGTRISQPISLSTKNSNQGSIKVNKFTCNSTRNTTQKATIFGNAPN